ncbi:hypothetical protein CFE70_010176 [Pyrenophora teres f. teres 0-1]|uniref:BTB domain-containing protein n=2 Tax=Pyrenophora teres f. teres TaxID=97479 RepID=E3S862_PYRTT|nr:hypothetical protein PTT_19087 [Pyrenophora teres f. teres 0-1]KAE8826622.1 hypothetical protein HRS9139_07794 [Pyrenophora teres f. teres]KAE8837253.1 hypothetical protein HRS9122_07408 [Pyrenophora teres f. teres]KAE8855800.1 hypothetical protein PTNB29_08639 [Pyrenophora teres f. teres]KAE8860546.1 hypothetical protein PTNB73_08156 [Pyrenophora teres f. teres]
MDDLSFLDQGSERDQVDATLKVVLAGGHVCHLSDRINTFMFVESCPLLYIAFEDCPHGRLQASIEATSTTAVISLLRYCYTRTYFHADPEFDPISLLPDVETYKIAEDFDVDKLRRMAQGSLSCKMEMAMYQHVPPQDLFDTIRFVYRHYTSLKVGKDHWLISTFLSYCISVFAQYDLEHDPDFRKLVDELPKFRQDLCLENMRREFGDECASNIIQLSHATLGDQSSILPTVLESRNLPQDMSDSISDTPIEPQDTTPVSGMQGREELTRGTEDDTHDQPGEENMVNSIIGLPASSLPCRPARTQLRTIFDTEADSSDDDHGFTLVYRPKAHFADSPEDPMSSPEVIATPVFDMLAVSGTPYPDDDDEWEMLE